jgi:hypothetical protein
VLCAVDRLHAGLAALQGNHDEADRLFACALAQERALRSAPLVARTLHWWGRALHDRGDHEHAAALLSEARVLAVDLGMHALVHQVDELTRSVAPGGTRG